MADTLKDLDYAIVQQCMHCGMCLPSCPTYLETGRERHSPRGRIALMRAVADDELELSPAFGEEMSYCLGCLACTTACPADVDYAHLLEKARTDVENSGVMAGKMRHFCRVLTLQGLFQHHRWLRLAGAVLRLYQTTGLDRRVRQAGLTRLLPESLRRLEPKTPRIAPHFSDALIGEVARPEGAARHRVGLLTGCVQDLLYAEVNRDTMEVLLENACEVVTPRLQGCCGSLHAHNGDLDGARRRARAMLDLFDLDGLDAIISNAAGCASHLKHLGRLLEDDPVYRQRAQQWDAKIKDATEWLVASGFRKAKAVSPPGATTCGTYHEACHLCHGQGISAAPREILESLPEFHWREMKEATRCCGAAGIYSITQPETADRLLRQKLDHVRETGATVVAMANPGCQLQIAQGLAEEPEAGGVQVRHVLSLLAEAYRREKRPAVPGRG